MLIPVNLSPSRRQLRTFGIICVLVFGALGVLAFFKHKLFGHALTMEASTTAAYALWGASLVSGSLTAIAPPALRPLYLALTILTLPIGFVVSHVMMAALYYLVVAPLGIGMRVFGWDPMMRRAEKSRDSYWTKRRARKDAAAYLRQY
jgi:hypothetical protein